MNGIFILIFRRTDNVRKKVDFDKTWKENHRTKVEYEKATSQRDGYKTSLDTVNEK